MFQRGSARLAAGPFLFALLLATAVSGCGQKTPELEEELQGIVELGRGAHLHRITVTGRSTTDRITPATVEVAPGDAVEIVVLDGRPHAFSFDVDVLQNDQRRFLTETRQLHGVLLVERGARLVLSFEGAPRGRYPFNCASHPGTGRGLIRVVE